MLSFAFWFVCFVLMIVSDREIEKETYPKGAAKAAGESTQAARAAVRMVARMSSVVRCGMWYDKSVG